ncbi:MAG: OB-fold nucleic acid binding domain-containing protein [archaeon GB-1867-035]|nr:OB-fold nucleic acid binding domain-containing protein [Candidatus Culexmicrobium profundum]
MSVVNVRDLRPGMSRVNVEVTVMKAFQPRTVITRDGRRVTLAEFEVSDDTGSIILTLWGDDINLVKQGDTVRIRNGYVTSFRGEPRLNIGRYGKIEQLTGTSEVSGTKSRKRRTVS